MDFVTPFVLAGALTAADHVSTTRALGRGGIEAGPVAQQSLAGGAALRFAGYSVLDLGVQRVTKKKWIHWTARALMAGATTAIVLRNDRMAR